jgi:hypothetical protein
MLPVVGEFEISASNHAVTASQDKTLKLPDALDKPDANPIPQPLPPHHSVESPSPTGASGVSTPGVFPFLHRDEQIACPLNPRGLYKGPLSKRYAFVWGSGRWLLDLIATTGIWSISSRHHIQGKFPAVHQS